jgi:hypothetical protein
VIVLRILALAVIWVGASLAWIALGGTLLFRTQQSDVAQRAQLGSLWGPEQSQSAPTFTYSSLAESRTVAPDASAIAVDLRLDQRRKGLLWYNTYHVDFAGTYRVRSSGDDRTLEFAFKLPAQNAVYDDVSVLVDGKRVADTLIAGVVTVDAPVTPHRPTEVSISYRSQGVGKWSYAFGTGISTVRDFNLVMQTNFKAIDFPEGTLAPTQERQTLSGWALDWHYRDLVTGYGIGMLFTQPLQPGPLAQRLTFWAPLSLLFYFFVLFVIITIQRIELHPVNFFFLAAAFFSFHLLFAYTVDRIPIFTAFALCSLVSMFLTVSYLRIVAGLRFAAVEAGLAQFFYLILFSLALFNEGFSGLAITVGSIITLFVTMQLTARINWSERFAQRPGRPAPS